MLNFIEKVKNTAREFQRTIVLPESNDDRVIKAAEQILKERLAKIILLGNEKEIAERAKNLKVNLDGAIIIDPLKDRNREKYATLLYELRKNKGMTLEKANELINNPLYFATLMVKAEDADGLVAGSLSPTPDVLRPALQVIKTKPEFSVVSGAFIMVIPNPQYGEHGIMLFADCAVNPDPNPQQLAEIAIASAMTAQKLLGITPYVGLLSFSTKGSAEHELVDKVREAARIANKLRPDLKIEGELQVDAAIVPSVGAKKAPGSEVAGRANVLIFPDLQSGNIGYKLAQRMSGGEAIGPILQGMAKPVNDLSRGCSVDEIVNLTAITAVQSYYGI